MYLTTYEQFFPNTTDSEPSMSENRHYQPRQNTVNKRLKRYSRWKHFRADLDGYFVRSFTTDVVSRKRTNFTLVRIGEGNGSSFSAITQNNWSAPESRIWIKSDTHPALFRVVARICFLPTTPRRNVFVLILRLHSTPIRTAPSRRR